jgi:hypothetical protein
VDYRLDPNNDAFIFLNLDAGVAQLVEQETLNLLVVGSSPSAGTILDTYCSRF